MKILVSLSLVPLLWAVGWFVGATDAAESSFLYVDDGVVVASDSQPADDSAADNSSNEANPQRAWADDSSAIRDEEVLAADSFVFVEEDAAEGSDEAPARGAGNYQALAAEEQSAYSNLGTKSSGGRPSARGNSSSAPTRSRRFR